jgi:hypothetical protein
VNIANSKKNAADLCIKENFCFIALLPREIYISFGDFQRFATNLDASEMKKGETLFQVRGFV